MGKVKCYNVKVCSVWRVTAQQTIIPGVYYLEHRALIALVHETARLNNMHRLSDVCFYFVVLQ